VKRRAWCLVAASLTVVVSGLSTPLAVAGGLPGGGWVTTPLPPVLTVPPPPAVEDATNFQEDSRHDGVAPGPALVPARLHLKWSTRLSGTPGYPIIANGEVFVSQNGNDATFQVLAFDAGTGRLLWKSAAIAGGGFGYNSLSYANGRLFSVGTSNGIVAFDAATGRIDWQYVQSPIDCEEATGVSTTANGNLFVPYDCDDIIEGYAGTTGGGGSDGAGPMGDLDRAGPAVTSDSIYVVVTCHDVRRYTLTGTLVWSRNDGCNGGGANTATVHGEQVWARDTLSYSQVGDVLSTHDGHLIGHFTGNAAPPAFDGSTAITLWQPPSGVNSTALVALSSSLKTIWKQASDGSITTAPVVSGHVAYVGTRDGSVYGYSTSTGAQVWHAALGDGVLGGDSTVGGVANLNIGDGLLAVPASGHLFLFGQ
jgi:outer membrane protein assembly factor BamB